MKQTLLILAIFMISITQLPAQESNEVQKWLTSTIEEYFAKFPLKPLNEITTEQYAEYMQDAICVVYECENSLTKEQFKQKWGGIYDTSYAEFGIGFLIDQQDWDNIVVTKCKLLEEREEGMFILEVEVTDTGFELTHLNEITVIQTLNGFKIDDVKKRK
ncbi:hypothetical protein GCM10011506_02160 [Marivirga lumbricoides]|uniref:DUF3828 domain-containing protein n=1 Tax=Marivirga lumbricoides TaxID=1046115 RepID=A0ABQ1L727_9BACT|nr:hypothetical protein GCM10011506_02160 [Marivirga lumbricoides]